MKKLNSRLLAVDLAECAIFVALMVVGAYVQIPFPLVPLTFQTVIAVLAGLLLGWKKGAISIAAYAVLGLIGAPVFAAGGGIFYVLKPSFGYIIGFIAAAAVSGLFYERKKKLWQVILLALGGFLADYVLGIIYFIAVWQLSGYEGLGGAIVTYNLIYMPKDIVLCVVAALISWQVAPVINRNRNRMKRTAQSATEAEVKGDKQTDNKNAVAE